MHHLHPVGDDEENKRRQRYPLESSKTNLQE